MNRETEELHETAADPAELDALAQLEAEAEAQASAAPARAAVIENTARELQPILSIAFSVLAPNWRVRPDEVEALANAYAPCVDKYFPGGLSSSPELGAVLVTLAIIGPRVAMKLPRKEPERAKQGEEKGKGAAPDAGQ